MNRKSIVQYFGQRRRYIRRASNSLTVTALVKSFARHTNVRFEQYMSRDCNCILLLQAETFDTTTVCPLHPLTHGCDPAITQMLLHFNEKRLLFVNYPQYANILAHRCVRMTMPLVLHVYVYKETLLLANQLLPARLNNKLVTYTNVLILNFICTKIYLRSYNRILEYDKKLKFKYGLFINTPDKARLQQYLGCIDNDDSDDDDNIFVLDLCRFLNSKDTH